MRSIKIWKDRYNDGGDSGMGSQGHLKDFKVGFLNKFIKEKEINSILDFGHGDLNIGREINCENYTGIDIFTPDNDYGLNLINCKFDEYSGGSADLTICLDVIYHILSDEQDYMLKTLDKIIEKSNKYIIIYAQDSRKVEYFDSKFSGHLFNSKWLQYLLDNKKSIVELIYEQPEPALGYTSAQFFVFKKISKG